MKTNTDRIPLIDENFYRDYVILLEDKEFAMSKEQLGRIKYLHNEGRTVKEISQYEQRDIFEIIVALLHLVKGGHALKPFNLGSDTN